MLVINLLTAAVLFEQEKVGFKFLLTSLYLKKKYLYCGGFYIDKRSLWKKMQKIRLCTLAGGAHLEVGHRKTRSWWTQI